MLLSVACEIMLDVSMFLMQHREPNFLADCNMLAYMSFSYAAYAHVLAHTLHAHMSYLNATCYMHVCAS